MRTPVHYYYEQTVTMVLEETRGLTVMVILMVVDMVMVIIAVMVECGPRHSHTLLLREHSQDGGTG